MKKIFFLATLLNVALWTLCVTSCNSNLPENGMEQPSAGPVDFDMLLEGSRAVLSTDGSGRFEEGDTVVVYARNAKDGRSQHYTLHLSNGKWMPELYWAEVGEDVEFTAWYVAPALRLHQAGQASSDYLHTLAADQQGMSFGFVVGTGSCAGWPKSAAPFRPYIASVASGAGEQGCIVF